MMKQITATIQKQLPESEGLLVQPQLKTRDLVKQKRMKLGISQIPSRRQAGRKRQVQHTEIDMDRKLQHSERYVKDNQPHYTTINPNDLCTYVTQARALASDLSADFVPHNSSPFFQVGV